MRHVTHQHAGSSVDEASCSLFAAIERVTCTAPACGGLRRMGVRVCNRCGQASQARSEALRRSCSALRNSSCSSARQASGANPVVRLTRLSEATVRDALQVLAPTGKPPQGSSLPCFPSLNRRTCAGPKSSFLPPTLVCLPIVILTWLPLLPCQNPLGTGPSLDCTMRLSLLLARPGLVQSTSQTCSMSRAGFMLTRFMLRCFAGFLLALCLLLPSGSLGHGSAGNARKRQAASHQDG